MKLDELVTTQLNEGTWALPMTSKAVHAIAKLMAAPITADEVIKVMYQYLGDDEFFDALGDLKDKDPKADARGIVRKHFIRLCSPQGRLDWVTLPKKAVADEIDFLISILE